MEMVFSLMKTRISIQVNGNMVKSMVKELIFLQNLEEK
jgi:hypothetical protein